jgi:hypothetical protein
VIALTVLAAWVAVAADVGVGLGLLVRNRDEQAGNTRAKQDAAQAAWLDAHTAARRGSRGSHHLAARRRGVDLRPAPWSDR